MYQRANYISCCCKSLYEEWKKCSVKDTGSHVCMGSQNNLVLPKQDYTYWAYFYGKFPICLPEAAEEGIDEKKGWDWPSQQNNFLTPIRWTVHRNFCCGPSSEKQQTKPVGVCISEKNYQFMQYTSACFATSVPSWEKNRLPGRIDSPHISLTSLLHGWVLVWYYGYSITCPSFAWR